MGFCAGSSRRWRASAPGLRRRPASVKRVQLSCFTLWRRKGGAQAERLGTVAIQAWQTVGGLQERSECDAMTLSLHPRARSRSSSFEAKPEPDPALRAPVLALWDSPIWRNTHEVDQRRSDCPGDCPLLGRGLTHPMRGAAVHSDRPRRYLCGSMAAAAAAAASARSCGSPVNTRIDSASRVRVIAVGIARCASDSLAGKYAKSCAPRPSTRSSG